MAAPNSIFNERGISIFEGMCRLAVEHQAINLGQGSPEGMEPEPALVAAAKAILADLD